MIKMRANRDDLLNVSVDRKDQLESQFINYLLISINVLDYWIDNHSFLCFFICQNVGVRAALSIKQLSKQHLDLFHSFHRDTYLGFQLFFCSYVSIRSASQFSFLLNINDLKRSSKPLQSNDESDGENVKYPEITETRKTRKPVISPAVPRYFSECSIGCLRETRADASNFCRSESLLSFCRLKTRPVTRIVLSPVFRITDNRFHGNAD